MVTRLEGIDYQMIRAMGVPNRRPPDALRRSSVPADAVVVSADNHYSLTEDIFFEQFPAHLKDKAPRIWRDKQHGCIQVGFNGKGMLDGPHAVAFGSFESVPGCYDLDARLKDLDRQGVAKELVFGNGMMALFLHPDLVLREWIYRTYNQYMAQLQHRSNGRFYPVGFINFWEPKKTAASIEEVKALGLKTFMLPINPGVNGAGERIHFHSREMTPVWEAVESSGLPVMFHIGESVQHGPVGQIGISTLVSMSPFRRVFGELIFGGILDRHPSLQIGFIEAGINWVASALQDCELIQAVYEPVNDWEKLQRDIRAYWAENMFASFQTDKIGLQQLDVLGADRVMWAADYPHPEGTHGYTLKAQELVVAAAGNPADACKILGGNLLRLLKLSH